MADRLKELRIKYAASLSTAYADPTASSGDWDNGDSGIIKLAATNLDLSGLDYQSIESTVLTQNLLENNKPIVGPKSGNLKFSAYLGNGSADGTAPTMCTLISKIFGGTPPTVTSKTYTLDDSNAGGSHTASVIYIDTDVSSQFTAGQCVLVGSRGDGGGDGQVRRIASITTAGSTATQLTLDLELPSAPSDTHTIVLSHTAWIDTDNTQSYIDWLALGEHVNNEFQGIGAMGPMTISGIGVGEVPTAEFDLKTSAWRWVPNGSVNAIDPDTASVGEPAPSQCEGLFIMGINGTVTYDAAQKMAVGNIGIDPGITFDEIPGLNGNNGIQGFKKTMVAPKFSGTILLEDAVDAGGNYDDLVNDYIEANTSSEISRNIVIQFGHTAQNCIAFTFPKCHLTAMPKPAAINNLQGVAVEFAGTRTGGTAGACVDSSFAIHWF